MSHQDSSTATTTFNSCWMSQRSPADTHSKPTSHLLFSPDEERWETPVSCILYHRNKILILESLIFHSIHIQNHLKVKQKRKYPVGDIKKSMNSGKTTLKGSWIIFDCIWLLSCLFVFLTLDNTYGNRFKFEQMQYICFSTAPTLPSKREGKIRMKV